MFSVLVTVPHISGRLLERVKIRIRLNAKILVRKGSVVRMHLTKLSREVGVPLAGIHCPSLEPTAHSLEPTTPNWNPLPPHWNPLPTHWNPLHPHWNPLLTLSSSSSNFVMGIEQCHGICSRMPVIFPDINTHSRNFLPFYCRPVSQ